MVNYVLSIEERASILAELQKCISDVNHPSLVNDIDKRIEIFVKMFELLTSDLGRWFLREKARSRLREIMLGRIAEYSANLRVQEHEYLSHLLEETRIFILNVNLQETLEAKALKEAMLEEEAAVAAVAEQVAVVVEAQQVAAAAVAEQQALAQQALAQQVVAVAGVNANIIKKQREELENAIRRRELAEEAAEEARQAALEKKEEEEEEDFQAYRRDRIQEAREQILCQRANYFLAVSEAERPARELLFQQDLEDVEAQVDWELEKEEEAFAAARAAYDAGRPARARLIEEALDEAAGEAAGKAAGEGEWGMGEGWAGEAEGEGEAAGEWEGVVPGWLQPRRLCFDDEE